jgi:hypothetical protein
MESGNSSLYSQKPVILPYMIHMNPVVTFRNYFPEVHFNIIRHTRAVSSGHTRSRSLFSPLLLRTRVFCLFVQRRCYSIECYFRLFRFRPFAVLGSDSPSVSCLNWKLELREARHKVSNTINHSSKYYIKINFRPHTKQTASLRFDVFTAAVMSLLVCGV